MAEKRTSKPAGVLVNYLEIPVRDMAASKSFFSAAFAWTFVDYGPDYASFNGAGIDGGFYSADVCMNAEQGSALIVFYSADLEASLAKVVSAGATVSKEIFSFPGGRRFHFVDPSNNEFAIWSE